MLCLWEIKAGKPPCGFRPPFYFGKEKPPAATAFETAIALEAATPT